VDWRHERFCDFGDPYEKIFSKTFEKSVDTGSLKCYNNSVERDRPQGAGALGQEDLKKNFDPDEKYGTLNT
jgi:hypothetical protein